ncbi:hypothetical protein L226DRAFT_8465 [Lentinus tigrinus ALCF2SS1-7]|uniref:uncharacterized protein n=1 Tax=Lentinus tigrinus ALCF2SS1-7 TaxID=1328758 RepID=UPI0011662708|nr:hypothetical protein L226DRAFT_8465 [Lentinus tigrinus ALCF2SS1-7]
MSPEEACPSAPEQPDDCVKGPERLSEPDISLASTSKQRRRRAKVVNTSSEATEDTPPSDATPRTRRKRRTAVQADEDSTPDPPNTPLATEVLENLARYPHCILLTRVGQFYESYFDQAAEVSRLLNIKLTKKSWAGQRILMCGFPLMYINKYLRVLVQQHNRFVAMCEEFPRNPTLGAKGGFDRRVVRIVTPGTLIDEPFLNPYENNYLLSVSPAVAASTESTPSCTAVGLAWIDVSTGEFYTKRTTIGAVQDELVRISPKEVIIDEGLDERSPIRTAISEENYFMSCFPLTEELTDALKSSAGAAEDLSPDDITSQVRASEEILPTSLSEEESAAVKLLTAFMHANLLEHMPTLSAPSRESVSPRMQIDSHTVKALEIREGMREGGAAGSLLSVIKRTVTSSGTRLLSRWLCSPSTSVTEINARQSLVAFFHARPFLRQDLLQNLRDAEDATRIVQKFLLGRGTFQDLTAICTTIDTWSLVKERILMERRMDERGGEAVDEAEWKSIGALMERLSDLDGLVGRIRTALVARESTISDSEAASDELPPPMPIRDPRNPLGITDWMIKPEFSTHLSKMHKTLQTLMTEKDLLERQLQVTYDSPSLTLRASPGQGMHVHVARKRDASQLRDHKDFIKLSESGSTCTFFHRGWSQLGTQISDTALAITVAEREAYEILRNEVIAHTSELRNNARIIDELDVTLAFANLAVEMRFVRPKVTEGTSYHVVNGRHPTVELGLLTSGRGFTPNTVTFTTESHLHLITGPNMAGKSTLLRQTALIAILAQTGSFVPADSAEIGIIDRVFSRVGAKDDLFRDRSTFMVEMLEASDILRRATPNSLVIMDEVGRGTTVDDGLAIAFATVHHLLSVNGCKAMFATHFHELADMLGHDPAQHKGQGPFSKVAFFCTGVDEVESGYFAYSYRVNPGVNRDSHGLKVAQLAGMPDSAVEVARSALAWLRKRSAERANYEHGLQMLGHALASRQ